jgi:hypothetical protein
VEGEDRKLPATNWDGYRSICGLGIIIPVIMSILSFNQACIL